MAAGRSLVSPEDQRVTFIELFFDLVFVFAVTQLVGLLHAGPDLLHLGQAVLVFWLIWWGWTQFTWALNAADTTHPLVELAMLVATGVAFFMVVTVPDAFAQGASWFALSYVLVRGIGLGLYGLVAAQNPVLRSALVSFSLFSIGGLGAVLLGGFLGGLLQYALWALAIGLDLLAAAAGGRLEGWNLQPEHFAERHGLFVIITLGEMLIVAALGVSGGDWTPQLLTVVIIAVAIAGGLWWTYFTRAKPMLDEALAAARGARQSTMARDVFSVIHFPLLFGVVLFAAALEVAISHPELALSFELRATLAASTLLFLGGTGVAVWRASGRVLALRLVSAVAVAAGVLLLADVNVVVSLSLILIGILFVVVVEQRGGTLIT